MQLTSKRGRDEDVSTIFLNDGVNEVLRGWTSSQKPHAPLELGHEGHGIVYKIPPLDGCVPHLPTRKLPARKKQERCYHRNKMPDSENQCNYNILL